MLGASCELASVMEFGFNGSVLVVAQVDRRILDFILRANSVLSSFQRQDRTQCSGDGEVY